MNVNKNSNYKENDSNSETELVDISEETLSKSQHQSGTSQKQTGSGQYRESAENSGEDYNEERFEANR